MALSGTDRIPLLSGVGPLADLDGGRSAAIQDVASGGADLVPILDGSGPLAQVSVTEAVSLTDIAAGGTREVPLLDGSGPLAVPSLIRRATLQEIADFGGSYHADAVHFDGAAFLTNEALSCTDTAFVLVSFWVKTSARATILCSDPEADINNLFSLSHTEDSGKAQFEFGDAGANNFIEPNSDPATVNVTDGSWHNSLCAADTNHPADEKIYKVYIDGVDRTIPRPDIKSAFLAAFDGMETTIGTDLDVFLDGDIADFQVYLLTSTPFVEGDIPLATRRLFIDDSGKPVDPSVAVASLGTPILLFSGDATTFATNQGTGGSFVITGSLTNASTSPSD